ncbi:MAG TPA: RsiV family protein, partial [Leptolinea sp.]
TKELDGFRGNFKDWQIPPEMAGYTSFMWIGYDVPLLTPDLVSIRFTVDYYMAGAAHPNHYFKVVNYDLTSGKEVTFKDVFKDPAKALDFLSKASKTSLNKPDFPLFEEGLQPKAENFTNWNLTKDSLRISFDPYQVAPYAAGAQEVLVPFKDLRDLVNTKIGFGAFIAR